jgi:hypothetical protein
VPPTGAAPSTSTTPSCQLLREQSHTTGAHAVVARSQGCVLFVCYGCYLPLKGRLVPPPHCMSLLLADSMFMLFCQLNRAKPFHSCVRCCMYNVVHRCPCTAEPPFGTVLALHCLQVKQQRAIPGQLSLKVLTLGCGCHTLLHHNCVVMLLQGSRAGCEGSGVPRYPVHSTRQPADTTTCWLPFFAAAAAAAGPTSVV